MQKVFNPAGEGIQASMVKSFGNQLTCYKLSYAIKFAYLYERGQIQVIISIPEGNMRILVATVALFMGLMTVETYAARIEARVDISQQKMRVYKNGRLQHVWAVSTARRGKVTPTGSWNAKWLSKYHKSSRYNNAPMPHSIFYSGNFAIHGTNQISKLGRPASAGCVRLHPSNAAKLFRMVQQNGKSNFRVRITH